MSFLFNRSKHKTPQDVVKSLNDVLHRLDTASVTDRKKLADEATKMLAQITVVLCGDQENDPVPDQITALAQEIYSSDMFLSLITHLPMLEFESRKDVIVVFSTMLRRQIGSSIPTVDYLATKPKIFDALLISYGNPDIGLTAGTIVRDCMKHEVLCRAVLKSQVFWTLFDTVANAQFEIATDAFATISDALCTHLKTATDFLTAHQTRFIEKMMMLMTSDNYVTQRQSLKLVSTLIRRRSNYTFMTAYISDPTNLRAVMVLLRNKSPIMRFEAFQIFKIFVANPKKTKPVHDILLRNKTRLVDFLKTLNSPTKKDDETFNDERNFIISQLLNLQPFNTPQQQQQTFQQAPAPLNPANMATSSPSVTSPTSMQQEAPYPGQATPQRYISTPTSQIPPQQRQQMELLQQQYSNIHLYTPSASPAPSAFNSNANLNGYFGSAAVAPTAATAAPTSAASKTGSDLDNGKNSSSALAENQNGSNIFSNGEELSSYPKGSHVNLAQHYPHHDGLSFIAEPIMEASNTNNGGSASGGSNSSSAGPSSANSSVGASSAGVARLKPQLMGAVGSAAVLTPVVQTDQVLLYPGAAPAVSPIPVSASSQSPSPAYHLNNNASGASLSPSPTTGSASGGFSGGGVHKSISSPLPTAASPVAGHSHFNNSNQHTNTPSSASSSLYNLTPGKHGSAETHNHHQQQSSLASSPSSASLSRTQSLSNATSPSAGSRGKGGLDGYGASGHGSPPSVPSYAQQQQMMQQQQQR